MPSDSMNVGKHIKTGNSRAACMREYRKSIRLEEYICNNVPKPTKLYAERHHEYKERHKNVSAEYMRNYRKCKTQDKAQENKTPQASASTDPTPTQIIYSYNQANEYV
jgi:hypothetical protein